MIRRRVLGLGASLLALLGCARRAPIAPAEDPALERIVIDTREPELFAAGHVPGAINIQLGWGQLLGRARAYVPELSTPLALVCSDQDEAERAAAVLADLGYQDVALHEGALASEDELELWTTDELDARLEADPDLVVIDVRTQGEWDNGVLDGALLFHEDEAPALAAELDRSKRYAIICEGGWRSSQLASWMRREGFEHAVNVIDGMAGYR